MIRFFSDVHDVKATVIGPEEVRLKAEIDFCGAEITKAYLDGVDLDDELDIVKQVSFGLTACFKIDILCRSKPKRNWWTFWYATALASPIAPVWKLTE